MHINTADAHIRILMLSHYSVTFNFAYSPISLKRVTSCQHNWLCLSRNFSLFYKRYNHSSYISLA
jgi:hypothetical protein